jgi:hypothetical protein
MTLTPTHTQYVTINDLIQEPNSLEVGEDKMFRQWISINK